MLRVLSFRCHLLASAIDCSYRCFHRVVDDSFLVDTRLLSWLAVWMAWCSAWHEQLLARRSAGQLGFASAYLPSIGELTCVASLIGIVALDSLRFVPVITGVLVLLLFFDAGVVARALRRQWIFWLGEISFSIYMLFGILLSRMMTVEVRLSHYFSSMIAIPLFIVIYLAVTVMLAQATYVTIERPFRQLARPSRTAVA